MSLVINRFKYKIVHNSPTLRISVKNRLFFSKQAHFVFGKLSEVANSEATKKLMQELPQNYKEIKSRINFDFDETRISIKHLLLTSSLVFQIGFSCRR
jgi:hypothetical protein